jgi:hypothetical protein
LPLDQVDSDKVTLRSATFEATPDFVRRDGERGTYWEVTGHEPLVVQRHPVQPRLSLDVTAEDGLPVHGAIPEELVTVEVDAVDPVYPLPTIDLAAHEPEPLVDGMIFPAATHSVTTESTPDGRRDRLDLFVGQFSDEEAGGDGSGRQILITRMAGRVYRSDSLDWEPPTIVRVEGVVIAGGVTFSVETADTDAVGGTILFQTDASDSWQLLHMRPIGGKRLSAASILPPGATVVRNARVYVRDEAGNVGQAQNKASGHVARPLPPPGVGDPLVVLEPKVPLSGFYTEATGTPRVSLDPGEHTGATFEFRIDDRPFVPYDGGSFAIEGEGAHVVEFRGSDGSGAIAIVAIDTEAPTLSGGPIGPPNAAGWYSAPVTIRFTCADFVSGVDEGGCPADVSITTEGRNRSANGTATDRAGNSTTLSVDGIDLDRTAPDVRINQPTGGFLVGAAGARLTGDAADSLSGVVGVVVTYTRQTGSGESIQRTADLACNGARTSCTWSAPPPPAGQWKAVARATDLAGHVKDSEAIFFSITPA